MLNLSGRAAQSRAEYSLVYDVIDMNCAQSVARLLMCAYEDSGRTTDVYYKRLTRMWNAFWPVHMHDILDGIDSGDEPVN